MSARFLAALLLTSATAMLAAPLEVAVVRQGEKLQLLRDGQPYFIRGGGGAEKALASLAKAGGNSIRLWGDDRLGETLDAAHKLGLTVTAGIWLGQVRQGFDWSDAAGLIKQREHVRAVVEKHKDHPALLLWALGNEMEDPEGANGAVWTAINGLARMVKEIDPRHPTMTVVAEIGGAKVPNFHALCPDVEILGINSYGGGASVAERYEKLGGVKPFILTEYGPNGIWEIKRDALGAYPEPTSTEKADAYRRAYRGTVLAKSGLCLRSYAFLWGQKQEVTATWFSMFLADGSRLAAAEAVAELWTGQAPANRVPVLTSLKLEGASAGAPGTAIRAALSISDPEKDALKVEWLLQRDPEEFGSGGDKEEAPPTFPDAIVRGDLTGAEVRLPADGGLYRLFAIVRDAHGGAAVANVPLRVNAPVRVAKAARVVLPLVLYGEAADAPTYVPAGWMGDAKAIKLEPASTERPHTGATCLRCDFTADAGWGGVVWQSPAGDWGDRGGGYDLTGAKKLSFWARGEKGGEVVSFEFGVIKQPKKLFDTGKGKLEKVALTTDWQRHEIDVSGQDLTRIKTGFVWTLASPGQPVTFYLDDIRWE